METSMNSGTEKSTLVTNQAMNSASSDQSETSKMPKTSKYRGVHRPKRGNIFNAYIAHTRVMPQHSVFLGGYEDEEDAAKAYDLAALKFRGGKARTNFPASNYEEELEVLRNMTGKEVIAALRRSSHQFSRGISAYRGVTEYRKGNSHKWKAKIGTRARFLGIYDTQAEAAVAFDMAEIKKNGFEAITNFDLKLYDVESILLSETQPKVEKDRAMQIEEATTYLPLRKKRRISSCDDQASTSVPSEDQEKVLEEGKANSMPFPFDLNELPNPEEEYSEDQNEGN